MPRRIEDFRGLTQASRVKLLHAIQRLPGRRLQELAEEAGIHANTAREHLHVLEEEGLITSRTLSTGERGRPPVVFEPVRFPEASEQADRRVARAQSTGDLLRRIDPSLDRSDALGIDAQHQLDAVYSHLEDVGLDPELDTEDLGFDVRPCTYHELIEKHGSLVCSVHARLIQDQLDLVPGPLHVEEMRSFVTPHSCRIVLGNADDPQPDPLCGTGTDPPDPESAAEAGDA